MLREFKFPDVGEGIAEGEIVHWLVKEGDWIEEDQDLVQVETDKAVITNIPAKRAFTFNLLWMIPVVNPAIMPLHIATSIVL